MNCQSCAAEVSAAARFCSQCGAAVQAPVETDALREKLQAALPPNLQIVRPLGKGGMGAVYLARDVFLDREVAIKTLPVDSGGTEEQRERFRREARIAARLTHPHIVPLHSFGQAEQTLYYVMGFVRGETLAARLDREKKIAPDEVRRILAQIADALTYAHEQDVIHRDLKPENILLDDASGRAVLADFGIARLTTSADALTRAGAVIGTPRYMSPEQAAGEQVDPRSDVYSLGLVGYRMLTGAAAFQGDTLPQLIVQQATRTPPSPAAIDPAVPEDLATSVMRCLEKDPVRRWSAGELRDSLKDGASVEMPEDLRALESLGAYALLLLCVAVALSPLEIFYWSQVEPGWRLLLELLQFTPLLCAMGTVVVAAEARKAQKPWLVIVRTMFRPPQWYWGWAPRALRRPGDAWDRLPAPIRHFRHTLSAMVLSGAFIMIALSFLFVGDAPRALVRAGAMPFSLLFVWFLVAFVVAERHLIRRNVPAAERSILLSAPSWRLPKIKLPAIVAILSEKPHGADGAKADVHDSPTVPKETASDPDAATTPLHP